MDDLTVKLPKSVKGVIRASCFQFGYRMMDRYYRELMESTPQTRQAILDDHARVLTDDIAGVVERWLTSQISGDCFFDEES